MALDAYLAYNFDEGTGTTSTDYGTAGINATGIPAWRTGHGGSGSAMDTTGAGNGIEVTIASPGTTWTVMMWVNADSFPNSYHNFFGDGATIWLECDGSGTIDLYTNAVGATLNGPTMTTGTWYHVAAVSEAGVGTRLVVNGVTQDSDTAVTTLGAGAVPIGGYGSEGFDGATDDFYLVFAALSDSEIQTYMATPPGAGSTPNEGAGAGTVSMAGTAAGQADHDGTGSGTVSITGTADGSAPAGANEGAGAGTVSMTGTAVGSDQTKTVGPGVVTTTIENLAPGTTYEFVVYAFNAEGDSGPSNAVQATTTSANSGSGLGTVSVTGTAAGQADHEGTGSGTVDLTGTAAGSHDAQGTGTGTVSITGTAAGVAGPPTPYPTSVSGSAVLDQYGNPYFTRSYHLWNVIGWAGRWDELAPASSTAEEEMTAACEAIASAGFNTVMFMTVTSDNNGERGPTTNGNTWDGISPWGAGGIGDLNESYWTLVDHMVDAAAANGLNVHLWLMSSYTMASGGPFASINTTNAATFGTAIGNRYKDRPNIVYIYGSDYFATEEAEIAACQSAIAATGDTHLFTVNYYAESGTSIDSSDSAPGSPPTGWAFQYVYSYNAAALEVRRAIADDTRPAIHLDGHYYQGASDDRLMSDLLGWAFASGSRGFWVGSESNWSQDSAGWVDAITSDPWPGSVFGPVTNALEALDGWEDLEPDLTSAFVTSSRGTDASAIPPGGGNGEYNNASPQNNYLTAAITGDGSLGVLYTPIARTGITVDDSLLDTSYTVFWLDPADGSTTPETIDTSYDTPGNNSAGDPGWFLVFRKSAGGSGAGTVSLTGTAAGQADHEGAGAGTVSYAGTAAGAADHTGTGSGTVTYAGTAVGARISEGDGAGTVSLTGTAAGSATSTGSGSGTVSLTGTAVGEITTEGSGAGTVSMTGTADGSAPTVGMNTGSGAGTVDLTGTASATADYEGAGSGTVNLTGTGSGLAPTVGMNYGQGAGTVAYAGTAEGATDHDGAGAGTVPLTGAAEGTAAHYGSGAGAVSMTGTADGVAVHYGSGAGTVTYTGTANGSAPAVGMNSGAGAGTVTYAGTADGVAVHYGTGAGTVSYAGTANGSAPVVGINTGSGAGTVSITGTADGANDRDGSGAGTVAYTGTAVGFSPIVGMNSGAGAGTVSVTGTADGKVQPIGYGSGTVAYTGTAVGFAPIVPMKFGAGAGTVQYVGTAGGGAYAVPAVPHPDRVLVVTSEPRVLKVEGVASESRVLEVEAENRTVRIV